MKILLPLLLSVLVGVAAGQALPKNFTREYDKFKDRTTVSRKDSIITGKAARVGALIFQPYLFYPGTSLGSDAGAEFAFLFTSVSRMCSGYCFIRSHGLILMADGERIDLGEGDWDGNAGGGESMYYEVPRASLEKLARASVVEFQLGGFEGKFAENDRTSVREILKLGTVPK